MTERRQAYRREPIELDLGEQIISIGPVSWMRRNDFGNEVMRQHSEILNSAVRIYVEETDTDVAIPQMEAKFAEKFSDPYLLFEYGLDADTLSVVRQLELTFDQIVAILLAICDVNSMAQLHPLLDPNSLTPTPLGGLLSELTAGGIDTPKTESGPDSSSPDLITTASVISPTQS